MRILKASAAAIQEALVVLSKGEVVAHATETCYGFACDLTNPKAVKKLFRIKKRPAKQPVSVLFPSAEEAKKFVLWSAEAEKLAKELLPGPLTIILPVQSGAPRLLTLPTTHYPLLTTLGIRISSHPLAMDLARRFGKPISTTSANIHGLPNTYSAEEIVAQFHGQAAQPDLIIDSGRLPGNPPSTIIDLSRGKGEIVRN